MAHDPHTNPAPSASRPNDSTQRPDSRPFINQVAENQQIFLEKTTYVSLSLKRPFETNWPEFGSFDPDLISIRVVTVCQTVRVSG